MVANVASWILADPQIGGQQPLNTDTVKNHNLGKLARIKDTSGVYGDGEAIYLAGVASTVQGSVVTYDDKAGTTALSVAGARGPCAVALSACVAGQYGWYQIKGTCVIKSATILAAKPMYATATGGQVDDAVVAGDKVDGLISTTADGTPNAGFATAEVCYPAMNGNG